MGRREGEYLAQSAYMTVPMLEAQLRAEVEMGNLSGAVQLFDRLLHRKRTPHAQACTKLIELAVTQRSRQAQWLLEATTETRTIEVDDCCRILRLLIVGGCERDALTRFADVILDGLNFSDDGMHNYFAHVASLLCLELHEAIATSRGRDTLDVSLITHERQLGAAAALCKRGQMLTPLFHLLMMGFGGREGAQTEAELVALASAPSHAASADKVAEARALVPSLPLNPSQQAAASACLDRRLTLVQGPPGTGKTATSVQVLLLWVRALGVRPVLATADSNVAVDNIGVALLANGIAVARLGRPEATAPELHPYMPDALGGVASAIATADVVLATCTGAGADSLAKTTFEYVLIDETAQAPPSHPLQPAPAPAPALPPPPRPPRDLGSISPRSRARRRPSRRPSSRSRAAAASSCCSATTSSFGRRS